MAKEDASVRKSITIDKESAFPEEPTTNSPPTHTGAGHQQTLSTWSNIGCNQWFSLAKPTLKVAPAGRNRSLVARTNMCGCAISFMAQII